MTIESFFNEKSLNQFYMHIRVVALLYVSLFGDFYFNL